MRLTKLSALCATVLLLAACGTCPPVDATGLKTVLGASLITVQGKTKDDQNRLTIRNARECAAQLWPGEC